jgi:nucleotide-binding universal stress UspA family protein
MTQRTSSVLVIGFEPSLLDFSSPDLAAFPGLTAAKILQALAADQARLQDLGYDVEVCLIDLGETAEAVVRERLRAKPYDCILIGAGVRTGASHFLLFERLINLLHSEAPQAKLCFNTNPADTAAAVQRWV